MQTFIIISPKSLVVRLTCVELFYNRHVFSVDLVLILHVDVIHIAYGKLCYKFLLALLTKKRSHLNATSVKKTNAKICFKFLWALLTKKRSYLNAIFVKKLKNF